MKTRFINSVQLFISLSFLISLLTAPPAAAQGIIPAPLATPTDAGEPLTSATISETLTCAQIQEWRRLFYAANYHGWLNMFIDLSVVMISITHIGVLLGTLSRKIYTIDYDDADSGKRWYRRYNVKRKRRR